MVNTQKTTMASSEDEPLMEVFSIRMRSGREKEGVGNCSRKTKEWGAHCCCKGKGTTFGVTTLVRESTLYSF